MKQSPIRPTEHGAGGSPSVCLAVVTYRRPDELELLLPRLAEQSSTVSPPAQLLVVDNDPDGGARPTFDRFASAHPDLEVRYVHERVPGIAAARNRALDEADTTLLVFIDDDEAPTDDWLTHLLTTYTSTGAAAVAGPVNPLYVVPPPSWIAEGPFHSSPEIPDGTALTYAATGNLLLDLAQVRRAGARMPAVGTRGGEDVIFTDTLARAGGQIVWCSRAEVHERIPEARVRPSWVLTRSMIDGNTDSVRRLVGDSTPGNRLKLSGAGLARLAGGLTRVAVAGARRSPKALGVGLHTTMRGLGMTLGAWGVVYDGYARPGKRRWHRVTNDVPAVRGREGAPTETSDTSAGARPAT